jgi:hypothetical protein
MFRADDLPTDAARMDNRGTGPETLRNVIDTPSERLILSYIWEALADPFSRTVTPLNQ